MEVKMDDNSRILVIPDMHAPHLHPDSLDFLNKLKKTLKPTRVICLGDELDYGAMSFHDSDPDLDSAGRELLLALGYIDTIHELFPKMDLLHSNHGSMAYRKAKHHGMPRHLLKSYNEVLGIPPEDWKWHERIILELPNGTKCCFAHSLGADVLKSSQSIGMSLVQGHHHASFELRYWQNYDKLNFAITSGCLIDDKSLAFAYNKLQIKRPIMGVTFIENSQPYLIPMALDEKGRWTGTRV
jgi:hypothetical protein